MKSFKTVLIAATFAVAPVLVHAAEPVGSTAAVTTVTAASAMPMTAEMIRASADSKRARRIAMDDKIRQQHEYDAMYSH
ncbi:hypothetical protein BH10PSE17_BH10PSE17_15820 [soil metagenome]